MEKKVVLCKVNVEFHSGEKYKGNMFLDINGIARKQLERALPIGEIKSYTCERL